eukprot:NODE_1222_length_947_cov_115.160976_g1176_i0.p1 GENE.NODE_1222_length_947_cov_115.160976_g1176_i0~~NODE_1222_length_947_cov_115.160976_g1176_i0.p1  ORF type:complete len:200 (+),score=33.12 NODE_1222_length_947_cov_115.160976_g1176_i0:76-675(+)
MAEHNEQRYFRYSRYGSGGERRGSMGGGGGSYANGFHGFSQGTGRFSELARPDGPFQSGPVWDDSKVLSEQHYHHGDHIHHHHQRHFHNFHDLHLIAAATETMDLRNTPQVDTRVIPSENGPIDMKLRPDLIGRTVFDNGAQQYGFGVQYRLDEGPLGPPSPRGDLGYHASGYAGYGGGYGGRGGGVVEEEYRHRRTSS